MDMGGNDKKKDSTSDQDYKIQGMSCASCAKAITKSVKKVPGVKKVKVNVSTDSMNVQMDSNVQDDAILNAVKSAGYKAQKIGNNVTFSKKPSKYLIEQIVKFSISLILTIPLWVGMGLMLGNVDTTGAKVICGPTFQIVLASIILFGVGYSFFVDVWAGIKTLTTNMYFLIVLGALAAYGLSIYNGVQDGWKYVPMNEGGHELYFETIGTIVTLALLGNIFENLAKVNTTNSLQKISDLIPSKAILVLNGKTQEIDTISLKLNDIVQVKPGDKVPTDGIITSGNGYVNESLVSGESKPIKKAIGDKIVAGSVVDQGSMQFKVTKVASDNTVSQILTLVQQAQGGDLKIGKLADKISAWFVPIVIFAALMTFMGWSIHDHAVSQRAIINAISALIAACPCALGLATPTAIMVGTGKASEIGIVFKNGNQLENLANLRAVVFDKTGTLTQGKMTLDQIQTLSKTYSDEEIKEYLKAVESNSQHPLATSLVASLPNVKTLKTTNFTNYTSKGVSAVVNNKTIKVGNVNWLTTDKDIVNKVNALQQEGKSVFMMTINDEPVAIVSLSDKIKPDAKQLITALNDLGIRTVMVTGDNLLTANYVAKQLGIKEVHADIPVSQKADFVASLQNGINKKGKPVHNVVAMVGDGINDTVALTKADIGITMSTSLDVAIASSDIILVNNDLMDIYRSVVVAKRTYRKIIGNIFWAFIYNIIMIPLAATGVLRPEFSAIAMALSSVSVVLNSLLLSVKNIKMPKKKHPDKLDSETLKPASYYINQDMKNMDMSNMKMDSKKSKQDNK
ncbi:putative copper-transporting ATPase PacS [Mesoplasma lactucae ATCC 49193]|nr:copper transporting ATPase [Mesoplasma lactucae ATCC 49193]MCL8216483.1 putative copper-transporting ATPase PacS [Mesoplasma lactucae ATCC 49193]